VCRSRSQSTRCGLQIASAHRWPGQDPPLPSHAPGQDPPLPSHADRCGHRPRARSDCCCAATPRVAASCGQRRALASRKSAAVPCRMGYCNHAGWDIVTMPDGISMPHRISMCCRRHLPQVRDSAVRRLELFDQRAGVRLADQVRRDEARRAVDLPAASPRRAGLSADAMPC
jgi:hypothetical protein